MSEAEFSGLKNLVTKKNDCKGFQDLRKKGLMKLWETPLEVVTVQNVKLNVQNTSELTPHCCFSLVLTIKFKPTYFLNIFWRLWDNAAVFLSLLSFSWIVVYVLM